MPERCAVLYSKLQPRAQHVDQIEPAVAALETPQGENRWDGIQIISDCRVDVEDERVFCPQDA
ncbi:hypothetical protein OKW29_000435 [Paraburkholderia sp. CI3]